MLVSFACVVELCLCGLLGWMRHHCIGGMVGVPGDGRWVDGCRELYEETKFMLKEFFEETSETEKRM